MYGWFTGLTILKGYRYFTKPHQQNLTRPGSLTSPERAIVTALAPTKLSYKHLTVASYQAIPYHVPRLNIEGIG
jgi:hypothetical protein